MFTLQRLKKNVESNETLKEELLDFVKKRLAKFKLSRTMDFTDTLSRLAWYKLSFHAETSIPVIMLATGLMVAYS